MPRDGTYTTPSLTVAEGIVEAPSVYCQTMRPVAGSTATRPLLDCSNTCVVVPDLMCMGEVQFADLGRGSFQRFTPVFASRPAVNESSSFSTIAITTPSATVSEEDMPRLLLAFG